MVDKTNNNIIQQAAQGLFRSMSAGIGSTVQTIARESSDNRKALSTIDNNFSRAVKKLDAVNRNITEQLQKNKFTNLENQFEKSRDHTDASLDRLENAINNLLGALGGSGSGGGAGSGGLPYMPLPEGRRPPPESKGPKEPGGSSRRGATGEDTFRTDRASRGRRAPTRAEVEGMRRSAASRLNNFRPGEPRLFDERGPRTDRAPPPKPGTAPRAPRVPTYDPVSGRFRDPKTGRYVKTPTAKPSVTSGFKTPGYDPLGSFRPGGQTSAGAYDPLGSYRPGGQSAVNVKPGVSTGSLARGGMRVAAYASGPDTPFFWQQGGADVLGATSKLAGQTAAGSVLGTAAKAVGSLPVTVFTMLAAMTTEANPASQELYFSLENYSKSPNKNTAQGVLQNLTGFKYSYSKDPKAYSEYISTLINSPLINDPTIGPYLRQEAAEFNSYWSKPREGIAGAWDSLSNYTYGVAGGNAGIYSIKLPSVSPAAREPGGGEGDVEATPSEGISLRGMSSSSVDLNQFLDPSKRGTDHATGLNPQFSGPLGQFLSEARQAGMNIQIGSGYRSVQRQKELWEGALRRYGSPGAARKWVAPPGRSRHNFGTAADLWVNGRKLGDPGTERETQWAHANAGKFGLGFRMGNEPWHIENGSGGFYDNQNLPMGTGLGSMEGNVPTPPAGMGEGVGSGYSSFAAASSMIPGAQFGLSNLPFGIQGLPSPLQGMIGSMFGGGFGMMGSLGGMFGSLMALGNAFSSFGNMFKSNSKPYKLESNETKTALAGSKSSVPKSVPERAVMMRRAERSNQPIETSSVSQPTVIGAPKAKDNNAKNTTLKNMMAHFDDSVSRANFAINHYISSEQNPSLGLA